MKINNHPPSFTDSRLIKFTFVSRDPVARYLASFENATLVTDSMIVYKYISIIYRDSLSKNNLKFI